MPAPATITCTRCRIPAPVDKLAMPDRCMDRQCPLKQVPQEKAA